MNRSSSVLVFSGNRDGLCGRCDLQRRAVVAVCIDPALVGVPQCGQCLVPLDVNKPGCPYGQHGCGGHLSCTEAGQVEEAG